MPLPPPSVNWKSTFPVGVGPALDTVAVIVKPVPGKTVPEGPPDCVMVGVKSANALEERRNRNRPRPAPRNKSVRERRIHTPWRRGICDPAAVFFGSRKEPRSMLCRFGGDAYG